MMIKPMERGREYYRQDGVSSTHDIALATGELPNKDSYRRYVTESCARIASHRVSEDALFLEIGVEHGSMVRRVMDNVNPPNPYWLVDSWDGRWTGKNSTVVYGGTDVEKVKAAFADCPNVNFLQGIAPDILWKLPDNPIGFVSICLGDRDDEIRSFAILGSRMAKGGIFVWDSFGRRKTTNYERDTFLKIARLNNLDFLALMTGQLIVFA